MAKTKLTPTLLEELRNKFVQGIEVNGGGRKLFTNTQKMRIGNTNKKHFKKPT